MSSPGDGATPVPDDRPLAERARAGDHRAYAELVRRYQDRVFRFLLRMIDVRDEAMDLTQDTFMKAYQALPGWRPEAQFRTWLFRIARNAALDSLRRSRRVAFVPLDEDTERADQAPTAEEWLDARRRHVHLERALRALPPDHREILLLREVEGLSYADMACVLAINEGTVKSRLARARVALLERYRHSTGETDHA